MTINDQVSPLVDGKISNNRAEIANIVHDSAAASEVVFGRYYVTFHEHFTAWMARAGTFVQTETARECIAENLHCELAEQHQDLLTEFVGSTVGVTGPVIDVCQEQMESMIRVIYSRFYSEGESFGSDLPHRLYGIALCAFLENASLEFIPELTDRAKSFSEEPFRYLTVHGEGDIEHAEAFQIALTYESRFGYRNMHAVLDRASKDVIGLFQRIFA